MESQAQTFRLFYYGVMNTSVINILMTCQLLSVKSQIDPVGECVVVVGLDASLIKIPVFTGKSMVEVTNCNMCSRVVW